MTDDLVARLRAAIERTEAAARAVELRHPSPWTTDRPGEGGLPTGIWVDDSNEEGVVVANGFYVADYLLALTPAVTLRHCAAHLRIVDSYTATVAIRDQATARLLTLPAVKDPADLHTWDRAHREATILRSVIENLADSGYGITEWIPEER